MFPLSLWDASLLLGATAAVLFITSELLSLYHGKANIPINKKRLRNAAITISILFLITVTINIADKIMMA